MDDRHQVESAQTTREARDAVANRKESDQDSRVLSALRRYLGAARYREETLDEAERSAGRRRASR